MPEKLPVNTKLILRVYFCAYVTDVFTKISAKSN